MQAISSLLVSHIIMWSLPKIPACGICRKAGSSAVSARREKAVAADWNHHNRHYAAPFPNTDQGCSFYHKMQAEHLTLLQHRWQERAIQPHGWEEIKVERPLPLPIIEHRETARRPRRNRRLRAMPGRWRSRQSRAKSCPAFSTMLALPYAGKRCKFS